jgi:hypothetical protein
MCPVATAPRFSDDTVKQQSVCQKTTPRGTDDKHLGKVISTLVASLTRFAFTPSPSTEYAHQPGCGFVFLQKMWIDWHDDFSEIKTLQQQSESISGP